MVIYLDEVAKGRPEQQQIDFIQRKVKLYRRKSPSTVRAEIENARGISLRVDTIRKRAHGVGLFGRAAPKKLLSGQDQSRENGLSLPKEMLEKSVDF